MKKKLKPGQLITFENVIYRATKGESMVDTCKKCDLWEQCPECKRNFECDWRIYLKKIVPKQLSKTRR